MGAKLILFVLTLIHIVSSTESTIPPRERIPLLSKNETTGRWFLPTEAEEKLSNTDFQDQLFHVVGIGGPTRTGKSFIIHFIRKF